MHLQKFIIFFLTVAVASALSSCKDKKENCYRDYTSADLAQLVYTKADTFVFKSDLGFYDTVMIGNMYESGVTEPAGCPDQRTNRIFHFYNSDSLFQKYGVNLVFIRKPLKDASAATLELDFSGYITSWQSPVQLQINGQMFNGVYPVAAPAGHYLSKIYWSKTYGIIRVDHSNGRIWERIDY